jgi:hypothetical protein
VKSSLLLNFQQTEKSIGPGTNYRFAAAVKLPVVTAAGFAGSSAASLPMIPGALGCGGEIPISPVTVARLFVEYGSGEDWFASYGQD